MEETTIENQQLTAQNEQATETLAAKLENIDLESSGDAQDQAPSSKAEETTPRRLIVYLRKQLLYLSKSPLVKPPDGMPSFKSWFGELSEQTLASSKKEAESTVVNGNGRDRRYRRDAEEGDVTARPPFRAGLSQPSQMGNFKHQPLRGTDRDKDRDRDTGDLRSLSDKYDRERSRGDRLGLPSHSTVLRTRDRDSAPHLNTEREPQRSTNKKRNGESSEDWRRGAEPTRTGRDEHHSRRDRDDRERPRDSSRQRERDSPPATRRERDDRERGDRRERERDDHREFTRRERDRDRFPEVEEDSRRWRDDGKREERLASRRDKDRDRSRDPGERDRDLKDGWTTTEDSHGKRSGRERRYDEGRDKDDRRDKEKEPAWMDAYVPPSTSGGILGGKGAEGEVDSIQAWKKDMKEREMKSKGLTAESPEAPSVGASKAQASEDTSASAPAKVAASQAEQPLDEIQMFKLMIRQEEQKRSTKTEEPSVDSSAQVTTAILRKPENGVPGLLRIREGRSPVPGSEVLQGQKSLPEAASATSAKNAGLILENGPSSKISAPTASSVSPSHSAALGAPPNLPSSFVPPSQLLAQLTGKIESTGPRLLNLRPLGEQNDMQPPRETVSPSVPFEPPRQSRLLAFGAQNTKTANQSLQGSSAQPRLPQQAIDPLYPNNHRTSASPVFHTVPQQVLLDRSGVHPHMIQGQFEGNIMRGNIENAPRHRNFDNGVHQGFPQHDGQRSNYLAEGSRESAILANQLESMRAGPMPLSNINDRGGFSLQQENMHHMSDLRVGNPSTPTGFGAASPVNSFDGQSGGAYSTGKGSRMAKHFEKTRDSNPQGSGRGQTPMLTPNGSVHLRQESQGMGNSIEGRNITDLLNMLNHSAQVQQRQQQIPGAQNQSHPQQSLQMGPPNNFSRHIPFNEPDDGRFAPDGLVPGLRPASHLARNREAMNGPGFSGPLEDIVPFNGRLPPQQRAGVEQLFSGPNAQFNQGLNGGRGMGGFQQPPIRGGPSPIGNFNAMQGPQQRMPPGLANLGGRPPHDASLFVGGNPGNFGVPAQNLHGGLQNLSSPQVLAQLQSAGLGLAGNQGQMRGGQGQGGQFVLPMGNALNAADFRGGPGGLGPNPLIGLGGPNINAVRGMAGLNPQQLQGPGQLPPNMGLRQQQQHPMPPPHLMQQSIPSQLQQQGLVGGQHNPNDLMALLMGGSHRE